VFAERHHPVEPVLQLLVYGVLQHEQQFVGRTGLDRPLRHGDHRPDVESGGLEPGVRSTLAGAVHAYDRLEEVEVRDLSTLGDPSRLDGSCERRSHFALAVRLHVRQDQVDVLGIQRTAGGLHHRPVDRIAMGWHLTTPPPFEPCSPTRSTAVRAARPVVRGACGPKGSARASSRPRWSTVRNVVRGSRGWVIVCLRGEAVLHVMGYGIGGTVTRLSPPGH
jgi:hypothetical protein